MVDVTARVLVDETLGLLQSFTQDTEQVTTLSSALGSGALDDPAEAFTFTVTDVRSGALGLSSGVVQIGSELMFVTTVDEFGTAVVAPWGRGYLGTTATSHNIGDLVTSQPTFPRTAVLDKINETVLRVFPKIFQAKVTTLTTIAPGITYDLPEDAVSVIDARWLPPTGTGTWVGIDMWRPSRGGTTVAGDPGVSVDVADFMTPGQPIEFTYAAVPTPFTNEQAVLSSTGLAASMRDVLVTGAASSLTTGAEIARLQQTSIEQQDRARLVPPSAALTTSRFLEQKFQLRLSEEVASLRSRYPIRLRRTWN